MEPTGSTAWKPVRICHTQHSAQQVAESEVNKQQRKQEEKLGKSSRRTQKQLENGSDNLLRVGNN